jgi:ankyrin repeat protein
MAEYNMQLINSVEENDLDGVLSSLRNGADINYHNGYPLRHSIKNNNYEIIKLLIDMGANINIENNNFLYDACSSKNNELVELLLKAHIDFDEEDDDILLNVCIFNNISDNLALLIDYGVIKMTPNRQVYCDHHLISIWIACSESRSYNVLEYMLNYYPGIILDNNLFVKQEYVIKYNFIRMLVRSISMKCIYF